MFTFLFGIKSHGFCASFVPNEREYCSAIIPIMARFCFPFRNGGNFFLPNREETDRFSLRERGKCGKLSFRKRQSSPSIRSFDCGWSVLRFIAGGGQSSSSFSVEKTGAKARA